MDDRATRVAVTEAAYRRGILINELAKVAKDHWRRWHDPFGLEVFADLLERSAAMLEHLDPIPEEAEFVRELARVDRTMAAQTREALAEYRYRPDAFEAASPEYERSMLERETAVRDQLAKMRPKSN